MTDNNITSSLQAQNKAGSMHGKSYWSSQYPSIPIQSPAPHQQTNSRMVPSVSAAWHDPLRQAFKQPHHSAVPAPGYLPNLSVTNAISGTLRGLAHSDANPTTRMPLSFDNEEQAGSKRIRIACDTCRKKKTKCDGQSPCSNCKSLRKKGACSYNDRSVKSKTNVPNLNRVKRSKINYDTPNGDVSGSIHTRLSNVEKVLLQLTQKLGAQEQIVNSETLQNSVYSIPSYSVSPDRDNEPDTSRPRMGIEREHYFGSHCLMSVFSDGSLDKIDKLIGPTDEKITLPIRNLPVVFVSQCKSFLLKWIDPPVIDHRKRRELFTRPFPLDSQLVYDLIDHCYVERAIISVVFPSGTVRDLFEDYYKNPELDPSERRQFKLSDFLIMTSSLLMSITSKIDKDAFSANSGEAASTADSTASNPTNSGSSEGRANSKSTHAITSLVLNISNDELFKLKDNLLDNAIFYYHRLSIISDGIETIKAILHLMVYNESNWFSSQVNYILAAIVVRFAQEIGLHKIETYKGLKLEDRMDRLQVWWLVSYFDIDLCFRSGKPPVINFADVTVNEDEEVESYCKIFIPKHLLQPDHSEPITDLLQSIEVHDVQYYRIYQAMLTKIRTKSYNQLFVSISKDLSFAKLAARLDTLNSDMAVLAETLPEYDRPRFFKDPDFHFIEYPDNLLQRDTVLMIHFTYLVHIMSINRLPYIMKKSGAKINMEESMRYMNIALDAARTVLVLVQQVKKEYTGLSFYNWLVLSAFLAIASAVLDFPEHPETESDLRLLIHTSMHFFAEQAQCREDQLDLVIFLQIDSLLGMLVKVMLSAVVKFYEVKLEVSFVDLYPGLREHLDSSKKEFPMIFEEKKAFQLKLLLVLAGKAKSVSKSLEQIVPGVTNAKSAPENQSIIRYIVETLARRENEMIENNTGITNYDPKFEELMIGMLKQHQHLQKKLQPEVQTFLTLNDAPAISQYVPSLNHSHDHQIQKHEVNHSAYDPTFNSATIFNDFVNEDDISLMFESQMANLPSLFYENNTFMN